jgi:hypothetical protein
MRTICKEARYIVLYCTVICCANQSAGKEMQDWPKLLYLYSRFKPGVTIHQWMEECNVHELGIDVRRFVSFAVVKVGVAGFYGLHRSCIS